MEIFWLCQQCDSTNNYEETKVCSVCGENIDPKSEEKCLYEMAEQLYEKAVTSKELFTACEYYLKVLSYKDARQKHSECQFKAEKTLLNEKLYEEAKQHFRSAEQHSLNARWTEAIQEYNQAEQKFNRLANFLDAKECACACHNEAARCLNSQIYFEAKRILESASTIEEYKKAADLFAKIEKFGDASAKMTACQKAIKDLTTKQDLADATRRYEIAVKIEQHASRLASLEKILSDYRAYESAAEFSQLFAYFRQSITETKKHVDYEHAVEIMAGADTATSFKNAAEIFGRLQGFKDSDERKKECTEKAEALIDEETYKMALETYEKGRKINIFNWRKYV